MGEAFRIDIRAQSDAATQSGRGLPHSKTWRNNWALHGGFTLVELMVAMSLLAVLVTALLMAFQQVQRAFRVGANQTDILENGRAIGSLFSRDVQEMTYAGITNDLSLLPNGTFNFDSNYFCFYANLAPGASVLPIKFPAFNKTGNIMLEELFLLKRNNDDWTAIKYAFDTNQTVTGVGTLYYKSTNCYYPDIEWITRPADATEQIGTNWASFRRIADGVVHLRVQAFDKQGNLITPPMMSNSAWTVIAPIPNGANDFSYAYAYTNLPAFVDIEIGLLEPQTLKQLEGRLMGVAPADVPKYCQDYLKEKAGRIHLFRQRIPVRNQSRIDI